MVKDGTLDEAAASGNRRIVEAWLVDALNLLPEDVGRHTAQVADYVSFLRERVPIKTSLEWMGVSEQAWREWRRAQPHDRESEA